MKLAGILKRKMENVCCVEENKKREKTKEICGY